MNRIMIIGCCGSGKSTLARKMGQLLELPVIHLDQHYWQSNWVETPTTQWTETVQQLSDQPSWIIDGNYGGTMDIRTARADTIIYLDYPTITCLWRITKRICQYHGKVRPDMPEGCRERFDVDFYHYVLTYNMLRRKKLIKKCANLQEKKRVLILKSDHEINRFIQQLV